MRRGEQSERDALVARNDAALERWPDQAGAAFTAEMGAVAEGLAILADRVLAGGDRLEAARTWRLAGNACFDLAAGRQRSALERAANAYRRSEMLSAGDAEPIDVVKLNYCLGNTLLQLSDAKDLAMARAAHERLTHALALAPSAMPAGVAMLERELASAGRVVALLTQAAGLSGEISALEGELRQIDRNEERAADAADINALFGVLEQEFEKAKPSLEPTRQTGLSDFMQRLKGVVERGTASGLTLQEMQANRGQLDSLQRELVAQAKNPSLKGPGAAAGSRHAKLLAAVQELKMAVGAVGMDPASPAGVRAQALDLFARVARLTTALNEAGSDADAVRLLERDQARAVAAEVRLFMRRANVMLARPVWPRCASTADPNQVFFSGSDAVRTIVSAACATVGLVVADAAPVGAQFAAERWQSLRGSGIAVFDLAEGGPQVCYELGIALALGTQLLLLAPATAAIPFDIAQNVARYPTLSALPALLAEQLDAACYGLQARSGGSALPATLAHAEELAAADAANALLGVAVKSLRAAGSDPVHFGDALQTFNSCLGNEAMEIVMPRWPGAYAERAAPRWFAVMPFRAAREPAYEAMLQVAREVGIEPVRGDTAEGQEIIGSIWDEICRSTHVTVDLTGFNLNVCLELGMAHTLGRKVLLVGDRGTAQALAATLPGAAKWRCHEFESAPGLRPELQKTLHRFFEQPGR